MHALALGVSDVIEMAMPVQASSVCSFCSNGRAEQQTLLFFERGLKVLERYVILFFVQVRLAKHKVTNPAREVSMQKVRACSLWIHIRKMSREKPTIAERAEHDPSGLLVFFEGPEQTH